MCVCVSLCVCVLVCCILVCMDVYVEVNKFVYIENWPKFLLLGNQDVRYAEDAVMKSMTRGHAILGKQ